MPMPHFLFYAAFPFYLNVKLMSTGKAYNLSHPLWVHLPKTQNLRNPRGGLGRGGRGGGRYVGEGGMKRLICLMRIFNEMGGCFDM